jgi:hypothetical protein
MKLYELARYTYFRIENDMTEDVFYLNHIDGCYSYTLDTQGNVIHFSVSTPVVELTPHEVYQVFNQQNK